MNGEGVEERLDFYGNSEGLERRDGGLYDRGAAAHDGDRGTMLAELGGDLETDAGTTSGQEGYFSLEDI